MRIKALLSDKIATELQLVFFWRLQFGYRALTLLCRLQERSTFVGMKKPLCAQLPCPCGCGRALDRAQLEAGQMSLPTRTCYRRVRQQCRSAQLPYKTYMTYYRFMAGAGTDNKLGRRPIFVLGRPDSYYLLARNRTRELPDPLGRALWELALKKESNE